MTTLVKRSFSDQSPGLKTSRLQPSTLNGTHRLPVDGELNKVAQVFLFIERYNYTPLNELKVTSLDFGILPLDKDILTRIANAIASMGFQNVSFNLENGVFSALDVQNLPIEIRLSDARNSPLRAIMNNRALTRMMLNSTKWNPKYVIVETRQDVDQLARYLKEEFPASRFLVLKTLYRQSHPIAIDVNMLAASLAMHLPKDSSLCIVEDYVSSRRPDFNQEFFTSLCYLTLSTGHSQHLSLMEGSVRTLEKETPLSQEDLDTINRGTFENMLDFVKEGLKFKPQQVLEHLLKSSNPIQNLLGVELLNPNDKNTFRMPVGEAYAPQMTSHQLSLIMELLNRNSSPVLVQRIYEIVLLGEDIESNAIELAPEFFNLYIKLRSLINTEAFTNELFNNIILRGCGSTKNATFFKLKMLEAYETKRKINKEVLTSYLKAFGGISLADITQPKHLSSDDFNFLAARAKKSHLLHLKLVADTSPEFWGLYMRWARQNPTKVQVTLEFLTELLLMKFEPLTTMAIIEKYTSKAHFDWVEVTFSFSSYLRALLQDFKQDEAYLSLVQFLEDNDLSSELFRSETVNLL